MWTGAYVSGQDRVAMMACVPQGYPGISIQWLKGDELLHSEVYPVIYVTQSSVYYCIVSGKTRLKYTFTIDLGTYTSFL